MCKEDIIKLYKRGYSLEFIINEYYRSKKAEDKIVNLKMKKLIIITNNFTKKEAREKVYKIIYGFLQKEA